MEDEEEVQEMLPLMVLSLESRSKRKKTTSATGNRGDHGRGQGRGSVDTGTVCIFVHALICRLQPRMCVIRVNMCRPVL
jgi:hypothetical protein